MKTSRLEGFSDGVMAIIITIMVLEIKVPHGTDWVVLEALIPVFGSYVMSFLYVAIYWNNHHHMIHLAENISGSVLWANLHLLFWLSLIPFVTGWMGENHFAPIPTALYGVVLMFSALAWLILQTALLSDHKKNSNLRDAIGNDMKGKYSFILYAIGVGIAFFIPSIAIVIYILVALMWLVPDRRLEAKLQGH